MINRAVLYYLNHTWLCVSTYICMFRLQKVVELCQNRVVLFDNMTKDPRVQAKQLEKLLDVVDSVNANNGGKPYSDQMFTCIKVNNTFFVVLHVEF